MWNLAPRKDIIVPTMIGGLPVANATTYLYSVHFSGDDNSTIGGTLIIYLRM